MVYLFHLLKLEGKIDGNLNNEISVLKAFIKFNNKINIDVFKNSHYAAIEIVKLYETDYYFVIRYHLKDDYNFKKTDYLFANFVRIKEILSEYHYQAILIADKMRSSNLTKSYIKQEFLNYNFNLVRVKYNLKNV